MENALRYIARISKVNLPRARMTGIGSPGIMVVEDNEYPKTYREKKSRVVIIIYLHLPYHNVTRRKGSAQQLVGVAGGREGGSPVIREPFAIFVSFVLSLGRTTFFSFLRFVRRGISFVHTRARGHHPFPFGRRP